MACYFSYNDCNELTEKVGKGMDHLFPVNQTANTKQRILEAAIDMFSRNGFSGVSIRDITKQVGIKESALYNHFRTKDELLEVIFKAFRDERQKALPPLEALEGILGGMTLEHFLLQGFAGFKRIVEDPLLMQMWRIVTIEQYCDERARAIILDDVYKGTIDFLEASFRILIAKGRMKPLDPRVLAFEYQYPIFAVMSEYLLVKIDDGDTAELEKRVESHIRYFIETVAPS